MVPPPLLASRSLAFAGLLTSIATSVTASAQALWVCAYFAGELEGAAERGGGAVGDGAGGEVGAVALSVWVWGSGAGFRVRSCAVFGFVA